MFLCSIADALFWWQHYNSGVVIAAFDVSMVMASALYDSIATVLWGWLYCDGMLGCLHCECSILWWHCGAGLWGFIVTASLCDRIVTAMLHVCGNAATVVLLQHFLDISEWCLSYSTSIAVLLLMNWHEHNSSQKHNYHATAVMVQVFVREWCSMWKQGWQCSKLLLNFAPLW